MLTSNNNQPSCWLLESISNGFIILDPQYTIKFANATAKSLLKFDDSCIGSELLELLPKDLANTFDQELEKAKRFQNEVQFIANYYHPTPKWIKVDIYPNKDGASILLRDSTSHNEVESKIHENHQKLVLLTEAANHIIFNEEPKIMLDSLFKDLSDYLDLDVYFNYIFDKETAKLRLMNYSGVSAATASAMEWLELGEAVCGHAAQDLNRIVVEDIQQSDDPRVSLVKSFGIKSYACHPLLSYGRLIGTLSFGSSKRSTFSLEELGLLETICKQFAIALERSLLFSELKNKNTELSTIFNGAMEGIVLLDAERTIVNVNPAACSLLGIELEDIISKKLTEVVIIKDFPIEDREITIHLNNNVEKVFEYSITKDIMPGFQLIIFRDITIKKQVMQALIEAKELAERASKAKSEFLSRMSHELRTPLNSIIGFSQILLDDNNDTFTQVQVERIQRILKSGRHLINLINDILDHSQIESGKVMLHLDDHINLKEIIEESIRIFPIEESKQVTIENRMNMTDDVNIKGDVTRVKQIMINLLSNAVKYNKPLGKVTVYSELTQSHVKIIIEDTGIGISKENQKQIFDPFYRIYHPEHNIEGTGIGLALVKNYVAMMGGSVGVSSNENEGSSFWFSLPLSP